MKIRLQVRSSMYHGMNLAQKYIGGYNNAKARVQIIPLHLKQGSSAIGVRNLA